MRCLLTGANGFVGRYVQSTIKGCVPLMQQNMVVDIRSAEALLRAVTMLGPFDAVIHLAAQSFVPASFDDPPETFAINFQGVYNLLEALRQTGFRGRFLYVGSADAYGRLEEYALPVTEVQPLRPRNPYAVSKVAAEALCYQWSQTEPFEIVMVRPFNHIGPGQSERFVISDFSRQVVEIKCGVRPSVIQVGDIDVTRDFTDVRDVVRAYGLLLEDGINGEVYNVCSGQEHSVREALELLIRQADIEAQIIQDPGRLRKAEQRRVVASCAKLRDATGWQPEIPFDQSLRDILTDWENRLS